MSDLDPGAAQASGGSPMRAGVRRARRLRRAWTAAFSVACHGVVVLVLAHAAPDAPPIAVVEQISVALVTLPPPPPPPPPPEPEKPQVPDEPAAAEPPPKRIPARVSPRPPPPQVAPVPAGKPSRAEGDSELSDAQVAGATTSGSGGAGRSCNMPQRLEAALRKDAMVRAAVADADRGRALLVWNGDWVRHGTQEGAGLAAVREAIMWEVAFAPEACRKEPVRGLVLLALNDGPAPPRLVVGSGQWRWADLLFHKGRATGSRR